MEEQRFDELTRKLAAPISRRSAVKAAIVTAVGGMFALNRGKEASAQTAGSYTCCTTSCNTVLFCPSGQTCCGSRCLLNCAGGATMDKNPYSGTYCKCVCGSGTTLCGGRCVTNTCTGGGTFSTSTCSCQCPAGTTLCGGSCVTNCASGQTLNTATCTCQCAPTPACNGVCCANGQSCVNGTCAAGYCSTVPGPGDTNCFVSCNNPGTCYCVLTVEGSACVNPDCGNFVPCNSSADCGVNSGSVCFTQGCCGPPPAGYAGFCIPACSGAAAAARPTPSWGHL